MSEISLNNASSPDLLNAAAGPLARTLRPAGADSATDTTSSDHSGSAQDGTNPFAALLSAVLTGTQPAPSVSATPAPELPQKTSENASPLLALPGTTASGTPPGAAPTNPEAGLPSGNHLPASGKMLPPVTSTTSGQTAAQATDAEPVNAPLAPGRPGVSLADITYARQLDQAAALTGNGLTPGTEPGDAARPAAVLGVAGRQLATSRGASSMPDAATGLLPMPSTLARNLGLNLVTDGMPVVEAGALTADELALRLGAADLPRGIAPGAGADLVGRQLAAFAAGPDSASLLAGSTAAGGPASADPASAALLNRLGTTTLPALMPLANSGTFAGGLADRLLMLGGPGVHSAKLKLYPEHLGELKVDIRIDDGAAEVWFATSTTQAREAIESSLPRLRELFAEQGIQLTRAQVDTGTSSMGNPGSQQQRQFSDDSWQRRDAGWRQVAALPGAGSLTGGPGGSPGAASRLLDTWA